MSAQLDRAGELEVGGDTDTTAAIVGALVGARDGADGLPAAALAGLADRPLSREHLEALARALVDAGPAPRPRWLLAMLRNLAVIPVLVVEILVRALGR